MCLIHVINTNKYYNVNRHMMYLLLNVKRLILLQETQKQDRNGMVESNS